MPDATLYATPAQHAEVDEKLDHFTPDMIGGVVEIQRKDGSHEVGVLHYYHRPAVASPHLASYLLGPSVDAEAPGYLYPSAEPVIILRRKAS
jgi:hypothetical protein